MYRRNTMATILVALAACARTAPSAPAGAQPEIDGRYPPGRKVADCNQAEVVARTTWREVLQGARQTIATDQVRLDTQRAILEAVIDLERRARAASARDYSDLSERCSNLNRLAADDSVPGASDGRALSERIRRAISSGNIAAVRKAPTAIAMGCGTRAPGQLAVAPSSRVSDPIREIVQGTEKMLNERRDAVDRAQADLSAFATLPQALELSRRLAPEYVLIVQAVEQWATACGYERGV